MSGHHARAPKSGPAPTLAYGDRLGDYLVNGFAGCGATSYVYRARRADSFEPVALKVLHPCLAGDQHKRARFLREAHLMMELAHPNVVRFHEIIDGPDALAFVMDYIEGETLSAWQARYDGALEEFDLACVFIDILRGLHHAHAAGIVHRDLKPANVMIARRGERYEARIIDFGVALRAGRPLPPSERDKIVGTAGYLSPEEIARPEELGPASDLYSLGVMIFESACGRRPFQGLAVRELMRAHELERPPRPRAFNPRLSEAFESVILRALRKEASARFRSAPEMIRALEGALRGVMALDRGALEALAEREAEVTRDWDRAVAVELSAARRAARALGRIAQVAFDLVAAPGVTGRKDDPHHLQRVCDGPLPLA